MQETWAVIWTGVWFASLAVFSVLSILVILFGGRDLAALLRSLRARHEAQADLTPPLPPPPMEP